MAVTSEVATGALLRALDDALPPGRIVVDPDALIRVERDQAAWAPSARPAVAVFPRSAEEIRRLVAAAAALGVPIVPRGAGTGLSGGANAIAGCVVCSTERMTEILEIDRANRVARVQPGVVNDDLKAAVAAEGLWYPPDPASSAWSTIGGNVATNAGGLCCGKYGVTRDYVLGLEAVVGSGQLVHLGRRTTKGVAGYDLTGLFVGSEGTLGVVTEVTLRLRPERPPVSATVVGFFPSLEGAGAAVAAITAAGLVPSALELVDQPSLQAVEDWRRMDLDCSAAALLLAQSDVPGPAGDAEAASMQACMEAAGASFALRSSDPVEAEQLFTARRLVYPAMERLGPVVTEDVCVPRSALPEMLAAIEVASRRHGIPVATVAHAADGNLHPLFHLPEDAEGRQRAVALFDEIVEVALRLSGTITGEHGVGLLKREGLRQELGPDVVALHHAVKAALDPAGLFNPGKVLVDLGETTPTMQSRR